MSRTLRRRVGVATTTAAVGLAGIASLPGGQAGAAVRTSGAAAAPTPKLSAIGTKKGLTITGPTQFRAGRVALSLRSVNAPSEIGVASFKKGYTFAQFSSDMKIFVASEGPKGATKAGIAALDRAAAHITIYGGLFADPGTSETGTVVLPPCRDVLRLERRGCAEAARQAHGDRPGGHPVFTSLDGQGDGPDR